MTTEMFALVLGAYSFFIIPSKPTFVVKLNFIVPLWLRFISKLIVSASFCGFSYLVATLLLVLVSLPPLYLLLLIALLNRFHSSFGFITHNWISVVTFRLMDVIYSGSFIISVFSHSGISMRFSSNLPLSMFLLLQPKKEATIIISLYNDIYLNRCIYNGEKLATVYF